MKNKIIALILISTLGLAGCSAQQTEETELKESKSAVEKEAYRMPNQQYLKQFMNFTKLSQVYEKQYGAPETFNTWNSELDQNVPENWGKAISRGEIDFVYKWYTPTQTITLTLKNINNVAQMSFSSKSHKNK